MQLFIPNSELWDAVGITVLPTTRQFDLPEIQTIVDAEFGDLIRLEGYDLVQSKDSLDLTVYWRGLDSIPADYIVFVHLFDPATGQIQVSMTACRGGSPILLLNG